MVMRAILRLCEAAAKVGVSYTEAAVSKLVGYLHPGAEVGRFLGPAHAFIGGATGRRAGVAGQ